MESMRAAQLNIPEGMIDLGPGQPSPSLLPLELLGEAAEHRLKLNDASLLAYGLEQGDGFLRNALADFLNKNYQISTDADQLFITAGASAGLDLICTLFAEKGDTIFVEEPSYFLALRIFVDHGLNIVGLPMDDQGIIIEALEEKLVQQKPVFLYTIPTFHNPSSITLSEDRRMRLVQLSMEHDFLIIADEVYHLLSYGEAPPVPMADFIGNNTIMSLGSFSKIMAPGLRLGWIQTCPELMSRLTNCGLLKSGGGLNPFTSSIIRSAIELGLQGRQLTRLKTVYSQRKNILGQALRAHLPASNFIEPEGGFYFWLRFSNKIDTARLLVHARRNQIGFLPGAVCSSMDGMKNYARLSFSYFDIPELEEGARRLGQVVKDHIK